MFQRLGGEAKRVLVVSEGIIIYFEADGQRLVQLTEGPEEEQLRHDLSEYCSMDTLAMMAVLVKIWPRVSVSS